MATFSNSVLVSSPGVLSVTPGVRADFAVWWGSNISSLRWSRISAGLVGAEEGGAGQSVTLVSEGWGWSTTTPNRLDIHAAVRVASSFTTPLQVRLQVMTSQQDTY